MYRDLVKQEKTTKGKIKKVIAILIHNSFFMVGFLSFTINLYIESMARHSLIEGLKYLFTSPLVFLVNMLIIAATYSFAMIIKRRFFWYCFVSFLWVLLGTVNGIVLLNRMTPFNVGDFSVLDDGLTIVTGYMPKGLLILAIVAIAAVLAGFVLLFIFGPKRGVKINYPRNIAVVLLVIMALFGGIKGAEKVGIVDTYFANLAYAYRDNGVPYSFISVWLDKGIDKPKNYSKETIQKMFNKDELSSDGTYKPKKVTQKEVAKTNAERPNIIFIQLESFMDVTCLKGLEFSQDPTPNFRKLQKTCSTGYLEVPAIGAGTANTEFECITGISARFFGPGEYPYKEVLKDETCESVAYDLKSLGYTSFAIHNHRGAFYARNVAFANLGFDNFTSLEYMNNVVTTPKNWAKDNILPQQITDAVKSTKGKDYVYTISVQGHGKYPEEQLLTSPKITVNKSQTSKQKWGFEYYVNQLYEMDKFVKALTDEFKDYDEDTVIVFYGDHIPALDINEDMLPKGRSLYNTEYIIWSNFGLEKKDKNQKAYQLTADVLDRVGIHEGLVMKYTQNHKNEKNYNKNLEAIAYDMLYGKKYVYGEKNPFKKTNLKMGIKDIKITDIVKIGSKYYIKGKNFTEFSKVSLDGEIIETTYLGPTMLATKQPISRSDLKNIKISQVEKYNEILSTTE